MRFLATLIGGLLGVLPGLLLIGFGLVVTGGGDGMIPYGMGGAALILVGVIAGGVVGWRGQSWIAAHLLLSVSGTLVATAVIVVVWVAASGPPDPILSARDCREVYELLGATGPQGEILDLPPLSEGEQLNLSETLDAFGTEANTDEVCLQLRADLETQTREAG